MFTWESVISELVLGHDPFYKLVVERWSFKICHILLAFEYTQRIFRRARQRGSACHEE